MNIKLFNPEELLLSSSNVETLQNELKKKKVFFWNSFGLLVIAILIFPFLPSRYGGAHFPKNLQDYETQICYIYAFSLLFFIYLYYKTVYLVKKDILKNTKLRFNAIVEKTKSESQIGTKDKVCTILLKPMGENEDVMAKKGLFYHLMKNIFPPKFSVQLPIEIYKSFKETALTIEVSTYSKTFLFFKELPKNKNNIT